MRGEVNPQRGISLEVVLLCVLIVVYLALKALWLTVDSYPPVADAAIFHLPDAMQVSSRLHREGASLPELLAARGYYPPLVYVVTAMALTPERLDPHRAVMVDSVFDVILILSAYALGTKLSGRSAGLMTALVSATSIYLLAFSREYFLDYPLTALVAAGWAAIALSDGFQDCPWSIAAGLVLCLGMLVKWTCFIFFVVPAAFWLASWMLMRAVRPVALGLLPLVFLALEGWLLLKLRPMWEMSLNLRPERYIGWLYAYYLAWWLMAWGLDRSKALAGVRGVTNVLRFMVVAAAVASPYYLHADISANVVSVRTESSAAGMLVNLGFYARAIFLVYLRNGLWPYFLVGLGMLLWDRSHPWRLMLPATLLLTPLAMSGFDHVECRYLMPLIPLLCYVAVFWIGRCGRAAPVLVLPLVGVALLNVGGWLFRDVPWLSRGDQLYHRRALNLVGGQNIGPELYPSLRKNPPFCPLGILPESVPWSAASVLAGLRANGSEVGYVPQNLPLDFLQDLTCTTTLQQRNITFRELSAPDLEANSPDYVLLFQEARTSGFVQVPDDLRNRIEKSYSTRYTIPAGDTGKLKILTRKQ